MFLQINDSHLNPYEMILAGMRKLINLLFSFLFVELELPIVLQAATLVYAIWFAG